ncbi:MAG TPA: MBL fold metallo-hydrolase [Polyangiaceae bacterium]|nr:MBL fold metallo-hydrolase [Polyangiaceae bacterium]
MTSVARRWLAASLGTSRWRLAARLVALSTALLLLGAWVSTDHFRSLGTSPGPSTLARMKASPEFTGDHFENAEPTGLMKVGPATTLGQWLLGDEQRSPNCPLPIVTDAAARLSAPPASGLRITWLGHSTTLIEIDGATLLSDPIWSERASPSRWVGPRRFHAPPIALADLPHIDAIIISHEHFDHLDMATVRALAPRGMEFHVPLGIGAHLEGWGVPRAQITEHDWWERAPIVAGVEIVSTPARHFNGRGVPWRIASLWTSWSIVGPKHRVFFSGDTGLTEAFREIARKNGPFDVALLEIGQYHPSWGDIHLGPAGALDAQAMLAATWVFPIHWGTFELGFHAWSEPAETLTVEAERRGVALLTPRPGEAIEPLLAGRGSESEPSARGSGATPWWRTLPPIAPRCP